MSPLELSPRASLADPASPSNSLPIPQLSQSRPEPTGEVFGNRTLKDDGVELDLKVTSCLPVGTKPHPSPQRQTGKRREIPSVSQIGLLPKFFPTKEPLIGLENEDARCRGLQVFSGIRAKYHVKNKTHQASQTLGLSAHPHHVRLAFSPPSLLDRFSINLFLLSHLLSCPLSALFTPVLQSQPNKSPSRGSGSSLNPIP